MATNTPRNIVQIGAVIAGVLGAWLFNQALGSSSVSGGSFLLYFLVGLIILVATAVWLSRYYTPGEDVITGDEVPAQEPRFARFLSRATLAAPLWLGIRLFLAYDWLNAGYHKLTDPKWFVTGEALMSSWTRSVTPAASGAAPVSYEFYRNFLQMMLDNQAYTWFSKIIIFGELAVGLGLLFGALTGFAAAGGIVMNTAFMFAGSLSSNPLLLLLEILIVWAWRAAGWMGVDRVLLPRLGVPGAPRATAGSVAAPSLRPTTQPAA
jgi:thiosulfate dehydrogenase [quinone] large subunit